MKIKRALKFLLFTIVFVLAATLFISCGKDNKDSKIIYCNVERDEKTDFMIPEIVETTKAKAMYRADVTYKNGEVSEYKLYRKYSNVLCATAKYENGLLTEINAPNKASREYSQFEYNDSGRVIRIQRAANYYITIEYNENGYISAYKSFIDGFVSLQYLYEYDGNRLIKKSEYRSDHLNENEKLLILSNYIVYEYSGANLIKETTYEIDSQNENEEKSYIVRSYIEYEYSDDKLVKESSYNLRYKNGIPEYKLNKKLKYEYKNGKLLNVTYEVKNGRSSNDIFESYYESGNLRSAYQALGTFYYRDYYIYTWVAGDEFCEYDEKGNVIKCKIDSYFEIECSYDENDNLVSLKAYADQENYFAFSYEYDKNGVCEKTHIYGIDGNELHTFDIFIMPLFSSDISTFEPVEGESDDIIIVRTFASSGDKIVSKYQYFYEASNYLLIEEEHYFANTGMTKTTKKKYSNFNEDTYRHDIIEIEGYDDQTGIKVIAKHQFDMKTYDYKVVEIKHYDKDGNEIQN